VSDLEALYGNGKSDTPLGGGRDEGAGAGVGPPGDAAAWRRRTASAVGDRVQREGDQAENGRRPTQRDTSRGVRSRTFQGEPQRPLGRQGVWIHRGRLHPEDRTERAGIPVTSVARTLFDYAEVVDSQRASTRTARRSRIASSASPASTTCRRMSSTSTSSAARSMGSETGRQRTSPARGGIGETRVCDWRAPDQAGQGRREAE
jgi:hypothetical protein